MQCRKARKIGFLKLSAKLHNPFGLRVGILRHGATSTPVDNKSLCDVREMIVAHKFIHPYLPRIKDAAHNGACYRNAISLRPRYAIEPNKEGFRA